MCTHFRGINIILVFVVTLSRDILVHLSNNDFIFLFKIFERDKGTDICIMVFRSMLRPYKQ